MYHIAFGNQQVCHPVLNQRDEICKEINNGIFWLSFGRGWLNKPQVVPGVLILIIIIINRLSILLSMGNFTYSCNIQVMQHLFDIQWHSLLQDHVQQITNLFQKSLTFSEDSLELKVYLSIEKQEIVCAQLQLLIFIYVLCNIVLLTYFMYFLPKSFLNLMVQPIIQLQMHYICISYSLFHGKGS